MTDTVSSIDNCRLLVTKLPPAPVSRPSAPSEAVDGSNQRLQQQQQEMQSDLAFFQGKQIAVSGFSIAQYKSNSINMGHRWFERWKKAWRVVFNLSKNCTSTFWWYLVVSKIWIAWIYFQEQDRGDRLVMPPPSSLPIHHRGLPKSWVTQSDHLSGPNSNIKGMHFDQLHQPPHTEGRSSCGNKKHFWYILIDSDVWQKSAFGHHNYTHYGI